MTETPSAPLALRVTGATRQLGGRAVLRDVSLDLPRQALVVLAGPNGAGKSSLLRAVTGRLALEAGTIAIDGRPAAAARRAGRLGIVPQDIALDAHLTVRDNLRLWARLAGLAEARVEPALRRGLEWAGLAERADASIASLSGGMRRRVNLLAGTLHEPALLLLDEPTAGLDDEARARFHALLADLRHRGVAMLLVSHDLDDLAKACDAVAVMDAGRLLACDPPDALTRRVGSPIGHVAVVLATEPSAAQQEALAGTGFARLGRREWSRAAGIGDVQAIERQLAAAGVAADEVRWRRTTLTSAVASLIARQREQPS